MFDRDQQEHVDCEGRLNESTESAEVEVTVPERFNRGVSLMVWVDTHGFPVDVELLEATEALKNGAGEA